MNDVAIPHGYDHEQHRREENPYREWERLHHPGKHARKSCHCFKTKPPKAKGDVITVKNKLEIKMGGKILIPGKEPISSLTDMALAREISGRAVIDVREALRLIPGSKIVRVTYPQGTMGSGLFLELPEGPPPAGNYCSDCCFPDWYAILRCHCHKEEPPPEPECEGFNFSGCQHDYNPQDHPKDPEMQQNAHYLKI